MMRASGEPHFQRSRSHAAASWLATDGAPIRAPHARPHRARAPAPPHRHLVAPVAGVVGCVDSGRFASHAKGAGDLRARHRGHAFRRLRHQRSRRSRFRSLRETHARPADRLPAHRSRRSRGVVPGADRHRACAGTAARSRDHSHVGGRRGARGHVSIFQAVLSAAAVLPGRGVQLGRAHGFQRSDRIDRRVSPGSSSSPASSGRRSTTPCTPWSIATTI